MSAAEAIRSHAEALGRARSSVMCQASRIPAGQLESVLARKAHPVLIFDLFDTLVRRRVRPEDTKAVAANIFVRWLHLDGAHASGFLQRRRLIERELGRLNLAQHGDAETPFSQVSARLWRSARDKGLIPAGLPQDRFEAIAEDCELAAERLVIEPVTEAIAALRSARAEGRRCLLATDFYMSRAWLSRLLAPLDLGIPPGDMFVSSDELASKRSGRLYARILDRLRVAPSALLMIGDNPHSDGAMARRNDIESLLVDHGHSAKSWIKLSNARQFKHSAATAIRSARAGLGFQGIGLPLVLFTERLFAEAKRRGDRELFFLSREGQLLERLFNRYQDALALSPGERIKTHYFLASRRACYVASLRPLEEERFESLFEQYKVMSAKDFLMTLRFRPGEITAVGREIGAIGRLDEKMDFADSEILRRLRSAPAFGDIYERRRSEQKKLFLRYLGQFRPPGHDCSQLVLVDVGWKGSTQDYIQSICGPAVTVRGYYLGLLGNPRNADRKAGLLFSNVTSPSPGFVIFNECRSLFEMFLHADHGSVLSYRDDEKGGEVIADLEPDDSEQSLIGAEIGPVTQSILDLFDEISRFRLIHNVSDRAWQDFVRRCHARTVFSITREQRDWARRTFHRENFGVYHRSRLASGSDLSFDERARLMLRLLRQPRRTLDGSFWPALMLHELGGYPLSLLYAMGRHAQDGLHSRRHKQGLGDSA